MEWFVREGSIVRSIWGKADTVLFIFAGAAGEFALNKAVDWLYFTGKLPADPIGRLFSTVVYARQIIFSEMERANATIDRISSIHTQVENARNSRIPDWAYRDVLYMLVHYSVASYELLERKLTLAEKDEVYNVFRRFAQRMQLHDLPATYTDWLISYEKHLVADLVKSRYTDDLFLQYKKHLGTFRYRILLEAQKELMPPTTKRMLGLGNSWLMKIIIPAYRAALFLGIGHSLRSMILPAQYRGQVNALDII